MLKAAPSTESSPQIRGLTIPGWLLRIEGLAVFASALVVYADQGWSGLALAALILAPDLAMLGYLVNGRTGAWIYNTFHVYTLPLVLLVGAFVAGQEVGMQIATIWLAHIGADRLLGYGLKYETGFKDTHLQRV